MGQAEFGCTSQCSDKCQKCDELQGPVESAMTYIARAAESDPEPQRMLLTSDGLSSLEAQEAFRRLIREKCPKGHAKVAYVPDAALVDAKEPRRVADALLANITQQLQPLGVKEVNLLILSRVNPLELQFCLEAVDCVYVEGGNTFYLLHHMKHSGFEHLIRPMVLEEGLVYVGCSAGSICAGRSASVAFWKGWDDPGFGLEWDLSKIGYDGLNLLPAGHSVFPHYQEHWAALVETKSPSLGHGIITVPDGGAFFVNQESNVLISTGQNLPRLPPQAL